MNLDVEQCVMREGDREGKHLLVWVDATRASMAIVAHQPDPTA